MPTPPAQEQRQPPTVRGVAAYEDGTPASGALVAITSLSSGSEVAVVSADPAGRFETTLEAGKYALAVTADHGFAWIESMSVPDLDAKISLSRTCRVLAGRVKGSIAGTRVEAVRKSPFTGDIFVADVRSDGTFALCLPEANYRIGLRGSMISFSRPVDLAAASDSVTTDLELEGFANRIVKQAPRDLTPVPAEIGGVVADILARDARVIGLGEATHGNAELVTARSALTFELIRRADARLVMFEVDAIAAMQLDDYVNGGKVDPSKAIAELGFWVTDTVEFLHFLEELRAYNATVRDKIHVWGIDVQNTQPPVELLLASAKALKLTPEGQAMLKAVAEKRGAPVRKFSPARRAALDALLARLATPRSTRNTDVRIAVAARSLIVQLGYLEGDTAGLYGQRRDAGMAALANYLVAQLAAPRACLWAHAGHVARELDGGVASMGQHLAAEAANRYYPIGFYIHEGSVRAWDAAGEVGVISHPIPRAPDYTVEGAVMAATKAPDIAWLPIKDMSPPLRMWLATPRYVREVGAVFTTEADLMTLRAVPRAFDAVVVIKSASDSTPTPTGVRKVEK